MNINVRTSGITRVKAVLDDKQVRYATMRAINDVAFMARKKITDDMLSDFDRPKTSYIRRYSYVRKARKDKLSATLGLDDSVNRGALYHHFTGGERKIRGFEYALMMKGYMPKNYRIVPAGGVKLDSYGNITASRYAQLMSYLRVHWKEGYDGNMRDDTKAGIEKVRVNKKGQKVTGGAKYFVVPVGSKNHLEPGIWKTSGIQDRNLVPIMLFVKSARYRKRFDFYKEVQSVYDKNYSRLFSMHYKRALATAR